MNARSELIRKHNSQNGVAHQVTRKAWSIIGNRKNDLLGLIVMIFLKYDIDLLKVLVVSCFMKCLNDW